MKKYAIILAGGVVLVAGAAVAVPHMIDWNKYKPQIQKGIEDATGYQVEFGGKIDLAILPFPHVVIENLAVRVPGQPPSDLITLKKAEVSVALAPLFGGEVSVNSVNLVEPVITVGIDRDGRQSWMTDRLKTMTAAKPEGAAPAQNNAPASAGGNKFALKKLQIENGTVRYNDARSGKETVLEKINTVLSADSLSGPFKAKGDITWNNQKVDVDVQSGRMDKAAKTVAVQADIRIANAQVNYSGIVGTAGGLDLQGETKIVTGNLSSTLTGLTGKASTLPPLPLNIQGLLTAKGDKAEVKTLKVTLGDLQASGAIGVTNIPAKDGPMVVAVNLDSGSQVSVESFLPVKSVKTVKGAADKDVPKTGVMKTLLPDTISLPVAADIKADLKLAGISYKGAAFGDVKINLEKKGSTITMTESIGQMPGGGQLSGKSGLTFASGSQGTGSGVVYSDPTLTFDMKGNATAPGKLLSAFLPEATIKSMQPMFKDPVTLAAAGNIRSNRVAVDSGSFALGSTSLALGSSSYTLDQTGKDDVVLSVTGRDINIDHFMGAKTAAPTAQDKVQTATPAPAAKPAAVLQDTLKKLNLPVDLTVKADLTNVTMQGTTYGALNVDGSLKGDSLEIKKAALTDAGGDVMQASGTIKSVSKLTGVDLVVGGKTADAVAFLSSFKVDTSKFPKDFGPLDLSVDLAGETPESLAFAARAKALGGEGQANGMLIKALSDKPAVDKLSLQVKHPNFEQLMRKFNPSYKAGVGIKKDMDVFANINMESDGYSLSGLKANIGNMNMTGDVRANTNGSKPDVKATLNADTIPLDILSGKDKTAKTSATAPKATPNASTNSDVRWSRNAINTDWMRAFNLDLTVNAKSVEYGNWVLNNTALAVTLKDGTLNIAKMDAAVYGGTMGLTAQVRSSAQERSPISFDVKTSFKDVALEPLAASFSGAKVIKARGDVSLDIDAKSSGISPAALVSALSGQGQLNGKNVVLQGFDLAAMSRSLVSTTKVVDNITGLASASMSGGETSFDKITGPFTISEGVINFDNFLMEGAAANITNKGQISLPRWVIDMNSTVDLATPEDAPNLEIRFQGPLDNPGNTFAGNAMQSYIQTRVNQKLQKVLTDKIGTKNPELNNLLQGVLGGGKAATPTPTPTPTPAPAATPSAAPATEAAPVTPAPAAEPAATPAPAAEPQLTPEEKVIKGIQSGNTEDAVKGVLEGLMGGR